MWWLWIIVGIILILTEIVTQGFICLWVGISCIITSIFVYYDADTKLVLLVFIASSTLFFFLGTPVLRNFLNQIRKTNVNMNSVVGEIGHVVEEIDLLKKTGLVKIGFENWRAVAENDEIIEKHTKVKVVGINGIKIIVQKERTS